MNIKKYIYSSHGNKFLIIEISDYGYSEVIAQCFTIEQAESLVGHLNKYNIEE